MVDYFNSQVTFLLSQTNEPTTQLKLINNQVAKSEFDEVKAGWVSVLMNLKAVVGFGVDLRNHIPGKTWDESYVEN